MKGKYFFNMNILIELTDLERFPRKYDFCLSLFLEVIKYLHLEMKSDNKEIESLIYFCGCV